MALVFYNLVLDIGVFDQEDYILSVLTSFLSLLCFGPFDFAKNISTIAFPYILF